MESRNWRDPKVSRCGTRPQEDEALTKPARNGPFCTLLDLEDGCKLSLHAAELGGRRGGGASRRSLWTCSHGVIVSQTRRCGKLGVGESREEARRTNLA